MVAMTEARRVKARMGEIISRPMAANSRIFQGAIVCMLAGVAVKGAPGLGLIADGVARETVDNTGGAVGALQVETQPGYYYFANSAAADLIARTDVGTDCFIVDDQTVAKTNGGATRSRAGKIIDVDVSGVLVAVGITL
jgi:hypothetical protein